VSRLTTKQRRAARRRHERYLPHEIRRAIVRRYANLTHDDVRRMWDAYQDEAPPFTLEALRRQFERDFLQPITLTTLSILNRRWFAFG
jgi:hypothetical protein